MADGVDPAAPSWRFPAAHETALLALGLGTSLALLVANRQAIAVLLEVAGATLLYGIALGGARRRKDGFTRTRFLASLAFVVWFYCAVARITPALGTTLRDRPLLAADEALFGQTPALACEQLSRAGLTDLLSLCYLTYFVYLTMGAVYATVSPAAARQQLSAYLFTAFALGYAGYLLVPAVGPANAFPDLFRTPLPSGQLGRLLMELVANGSSRYDTFPSLHVLITCMLLAHDWVALRRRFWIMLVPSLGLLVSTVYLRYHYAVDLLAGLLLFLGLWFLANRQVAADVSPAVEPGVPPSGTSRPNARTSWNSQHPVRTARRRPLLALVSQRRRKVILPE